MPLRLSLNELSAFIQAAQVAEIYTPSTGNAKDWKAGIQTMTDENLYKLSGALQTMFRFAHKLAMQELEFRASY